MSAFGILLLLLLAWWEGPKARLYLWYNIIMFSIAALCNHFLGTTDGPDMDGKCRQQQHDERIRAVLVLIVGGYIVYRMARAKGWM